MIGTVRPKNLRLSSRKAPRGRPPSYEPDHSCHPTAMACQNCRSPTKGIDGRTVKAPVCLDCWLGRPFNKRCPRCSTENVLCRQYISGVACDLCKAEGRTATMHPDRTANKP